MEWRVWISDGSCSVLDIKNCFEYIWKEHGENLSIRVNVNQTANRITFKIGTFSRTFNCRNSEITWKH